MNEFKVICADGDTGTDIVMIASNPDFLRQKIQVLMRYTRSIDPFFALIEPEIMEYKGELAEQYRIELERKKRLSLSKSEKALSWKSYKNPSAHDVAGTPNENLQLFTHFVILNNVLPRIVRSIYGENCFMAARVNCHSAGLLGSGLNALCNVEFSSRSYDKVEAGDILPGDLVKAGRHGTNDHSFVYLDRDICLSANGAGANFEIHPLKFVLQLYQFPEDLLDNSSDQCAIFRKKDGVMCVPESIMPAILEFYDIQRRPWDSNERGSDTYSRVQPMLDTIKRAYKRSNAEEKRSIKIVYQAMLRTLNADFSMIKENELEDQQTTTFFKPLPNVVIQPSGCPADPTCFQPGLSDL